MPGTSTDEERGYWIHAAEFSVLDVTTPDFALTVFPLGHRDIDGLVGPWFDHKQCRRQAGWPCGERGEFHTFVTHSPLFAAPIDVEVGEIVEREGFVFADLVVPYGRQSSV